MPQIVRNQDLWHYIFYGNARLVRPVPKEIQKLEEIRTKHTRFWMENKARLNLAGEVKSARLNHAAYDVITGCYLPASRLWGAHQRWGELGPVSAAGQ